MATTTGRSVRRRTVVTALGVFALSAAGPGLSTSDDAATAPAPDSSSSRNLALGVGLMGAGTAALFGGFALAVVRRRRATA